MGIESAIRLIAELRGLLAESFERAEDSGIRRATKRQLAAKIEVLRDLRDTAQHQRQEQQQQQQEQQPQYDPSEPPTEQIIPDLIPGPTLSLPETVARQISPIGQSAPGQIVSDFNRFLNTMQSNCIDILDLIERNGRVLDDAPGVKDLQRAAETRLRIVEQLNDVSPETFDRDYFRARFAAAMKDLTIDLGSIVDVLREQIAKDRLDLDVRTAKRP